jgi:hypothetical protein
MMTRASWFGCIDRHRKARTGSEQIERCTRDRALVCNAVGDVDSGACTLLGYSDAVARGDNRPKHRLRPDHVKGAL